MLKIAVVDDCKKDRDILKEQVITFFKNTNDQFEVILYESGIDLCKCIVKHSYDLIFLDIQMEDLDGIETRNEILAYCKNSYIIFVSSYEQRIKELFGEKVIGFILKPAMQQDISEKLKYVIEKKENKKTYHYTKHGRNYSVFLDDIVYFESKKHYVAIHTNDHTIEYKDKLSSVWERLEVEYNYSRVHQSYIVNLNYARFISRNEISMNSKKGNQIIKISRNYKEAVNKKLFEFSSIVGEEI